MANNIGTYFTDGSASTAGYTMLSHGTAQVSPIAGTLTSVDVWVSATASTYKIKIFHSDGTNYNLVGEQTVSLTAGANVGVSVNIAGVSVGDFIAVYFPATAGYPQYKTVVNTDTAYKAGDGGTSAIATWSDQNGNAYAFAGVVAAPAVLINNICIGGAWKTVTENTICIGGVWKTITEIKVAIGGVWKNLTT